MPTLMRCSCVCAAAALYAAAIIPARATGTYNYTVISAPGAQQTVFAGLNDSGSVVGYWVDAAQVQHGFTFAGGKIATLDVPGASGTSATGINAQGDVTGYDSDSAGSVHGFVVQAGQMTKIDLPGATLTEPLRINKAGVVVGVWVDAHGKEGGFTYRNGAFKTFQVGASMFVTGFNDSGTVLGYYNNNAGSVQQGFIRIAGRVKKVVIANSKLVNPTGLNAANSFVGYFNDDAVPDPNLSGFVQSGTTFTLVNYPHTKVSQAAAINDQGTIAGYYQPNGSQTLFSYVYDGTNFSKVGPKGSSEVDAGAINNAGQVAGNFNNGSGNQVFLATPR